jgi:hypothetical protein
MSLDHFGGGGVPQEYRDFGKRSKTPKRSRTNALAYTGGLECPSTECYDKISQINKTSSITLKYASTE